MAEANATSYGGMAIDSVLTSTGKKIDFRDLDLSKFIEGVKKAQIQSDSFVSVFQFMTKEQITAAVLRTRTVDHTGAIKEAVNTGKHIHFPSADYVVMKPTIGRTGGQILSGDGAGGSAQPDMGDLLRNYSPGTRFYAKGTAPRRVMTRRKHVTGANDTTDEPMSAVIDVEAEAVVLRDFCVWLDVDADDPGTPGNLNYGADWDIGVFSGTRADLNCSRVTTIGYFRKAGFYLDVTRGDEIPELNDYDGNPLPRGSLPNGGDATSMYDCKSRGGRIGLAILGATFGPGGKYADYYDHTTGAVYADNRGGWGFSDFNCYGGYFSSVDHHSNYRSADPINSGALTRSGMESEDTFAPAAVYIDGRASNSTGAVQNMCFWGTRIATWQIFRLRLNKAARVHLYGVWIEGMNHGRKNTDGKVVDVDDFTANTYGLISSTDLTGTVEAYGKNNTSTGNNAWFIGRVYGASDNGLHVGETMDAYTFQSPTSIVLGNTTGWTRFEKSGVRQWSISGNSTTFYPELDNQYAIGSSANRISQLYAGTSSISTSDAREKTDVRAFNDAELAAASDLAKEIGFYKFLSSVEEKGDTAREHCGMTVQRAIEVMESHALDAMNYSFICYDSWEEIPAEFGEDGDLIADKKDAGDRYSFREAQLYAFIIKGLFQSFSSINDRISDLEK